MYICGLQKLAMVDYPGKLAATVFTGGCNLRCPFCHNALLVTRLEESPAIPAEEVLSFLSSRKGLLDGVVLSGGEPLLQPDAPVFLEKVKAMGFAVKLDTNGCCPNMLADILSRGLVDYVAMDIKNSRKRYAETVGIPDFDIAPVEKSICLLKESGVEYEFRTTVTKELHSPEDIRAIGEWVGSTPRYCIQQFVDSGNLIKPGLHPLEKDELLALQAIAQDFFPVVELRGVD